MKGAALLCLVLFGCLACPAQQPASTPPAGTPAALKTASPESADQPSAQPTTPAASRPQQPGRSTDGTYTLRASARLVVLDLIATDKQENVVTDLRRGGLPGHGGG